MRYRVFHEKETQIEVEQQGMYEWQIIKTNLEDSSVQSLKLTKEQLYQIERFLKMGIHKNE